MAVLVREPDNSKDPDALIPPNDGRSAGRDRLLLP